MRTGSRRAFREHHDARARRSGRAQTRRTARSAAPGRAGATSHGAGSHGSGASHSSVTGVHVTINHARSSLSFGVTGSPGTRSDTPPLAPRPRDLPAFPLGP